jgi:hypothetical protein
MMSKWFAQASLGVCALALVGCADALIFAERTSFNLAVSVNDDPTHPLSANAGFHRRIINFTPALGGTVQPRGGGDPIPHGEATSMIADFSLRYKPETAAPLAGKLVITTKFVSGEAAVITGENIEAVKKIVESTTK